MIQLNIWHIVYRWKDNFMLIKFCKKTYTRKLSYRTLKSSYLLFIFLYEKSLVKVKTVRENMIDPRRSIILYHTVFLQSGPTCDINAPCRLK